MTVLVQLQDRQDGRRRRGPEDSRVAPQFTTTEVSANCGRLEMEGQIQPRSGGNTRECTEKGVSYFGEDKMPINDERRRFGRSKTTTHTKPQAAANTEGGSGPKEGAKGSKESIERLREMLMMQQDEEAEHHTEERIEASRQAAQRARDERKEKYERLQQAFERMNRQKDKEGVEMPGEWSKRVQGANRVCSIIR